MCFKVKYENSVSEYIKNWMNSVQFESKRFGCVCVFFFDSLHLQCNTKINRKIEKEIYTMNEIKCNVVKD